MYVTYTKLLLAVSVIGFSFKLSLELRKCAESGQLEFADPAFGDLVDRHGIDEVHLFSPLPFPGHEIGLLENRQMLRDRLAGHAQPLAQLAQRLAIPAVQPIQQLPTICIGQSAKHSIVIHAGNTKPFGYLTIGNLLVACQAERFAPASVMLSQMNRLCPLSTLHPRRGLRDGFVQSFAQFHLDRLERRSFWRSQPSSCRRAYPPAGPGLVPGIQYPRVAVYRSVGIVEGSGTNVSGALRDTGSEPARRRFPRRD